MSSTRDAGALRQMPEIEAHAVAVAVLERNPLRTRRIVAQVAQRVDVRADVVAEDDQVAGGQPVDAVLGRADVVRRTASSLSYIAIEGRTTRGNATMSLCTRMLKSIRRRLIQDCLLECAIGDRR